MLLTGWCNGLDSQLVQISMPGPTSLYLGLHIERNVAITQFGIAVPLRVALNLSLQFDIFELRAVLFKSDSGQ